MAPYRLVHPIRPVEPKKEVGCTRGWDCSRPDGEVCQARYRSCYQSCGGTVTANTVCVANCDKLVSNQGLQENANPASAAVGKAKEALADLCEDADYEQFLELAPCDEEKLTLVQLTNNSRLSPDLVEAVSSFRSHEKAIELEIASSIGKAGGKKSYRAAKLFQETSKKSDQLYMRLVEQKISMGEFNKGRQELRSKFNNELAKLGN